MSKSDEILKQIGEAGGKAWDEVTDVEAKRRELRGYEQQILQEPIGEASLGESGVQSAAMIFEVRDEINKNLNQAIKELRAIPWWRPLSRSDAALIVMVWLQVSWLVDAKIEELQIEHDAKCRADD